MIFQILLYPLYVTISCLRGQEIEEPTEGTPTHSESTAYESQRMSPINQPRASQKPDGQYSDMSTAVAHRESSQFSKAMTERTQNIENCKRSSSNDQVIPLPDPDTGLCTGDEIIGIQGSRTCATGKQYEIRVRDCNMIEDVVWVGKAVEQRADFQYHWSSGGYAV